MAQAQQKESDESLQVLPTQCERWLQAFFCCLSAYQFEFDAIFSIICTKKHVMQLFHGHLVASLEIPRPVHGKPFAACIASTCGCATRGATSGEGPWGASKHVQLWTSMFLPHVTQLLSYPAIL